jgi:hypothetical protein
MKRAFVETFGGARQASTDCLSMLDTLPQVLRKDIEHGMRAIRMFYQIGNHMRKIVDRHAAQPFFLQQSYGLAKIGSAIFQIGNGAADRGDDALQQSRDAFTGPGISHRDSDTAHML